MNIFSRSDKTAEVIKYSKDYMSMQSTATRALLKFCQDHDVGGTYVEDLRKCLLALTSSDIESAVKHYRAIPVGNMGCLDDWSPHAACEHENDEYAREVFQALIEHWVRLMNLSLPNQGTRR
jgi:hypothetical protein